MADTFTKDAEAILDFSVDWSAWLAAGESISSSVWSVPAGLGTPFSPTYGSGSATVWLSGGTDGADYVCTNRIVTSAGRTDERSITIRVRSR